MSKQIVFSSVGVPLFGTPVCYPDKLCRKTIFVDVHTDSDGSVVTQHVCVEDELSSISSVEFSDVSISNLVKNGIDTHSLNMIEVSKLGIDRSIDSIANEIISNSSKFIVNS